MSWQAQTAVTYHSKQTNIGLLRLLHVLAEKADATGSIDPAPNQSTLAEIFDCTDRTIRNRINVLCDSGELKQTRVGSGPGNPSAYLICLPMPENTGNDYDKGGKMAETNPAIVSTFADEMAEIKAEILTIKAEISQLKAEKVETKGGKGGNERRKGSWSNSVDEPIRTNYDPENIYTHELPSDAVPFPDEEEQRMEMVTALSGEVKETAAIGFTDRKFDNAAAGLIARGIRPEQIKGFSTWWSENGFYNGKPSLSSLVTELDNFINGVKKKSGENGRPNPQKEQAWIGGAL